MRILFVVKNKEDSAGHGTYNFGGLLLSASFTVNALNGIDGVDAKAVSVLDNSLIWKEVKDFYPDIVIIDGLWVIPDKFIELHNMFPNVKWVIRSHSKTAFLATEGIAIDWLYKYSDLYDSNVWIAGNNKEFVHDLDIIGISAIHLPNIYKPFYSEPQ